MTEERNGKSVSQTLFSLDAVLSGVTERIRRARHEAVLPCQQDRLRSFIAACLEASLKTEEGHFPRFTAVIDIDRGAQEFRAPLAFKSSLAPAPHSAGDKTAVLARQLAKYSAITQPGRDCFYVSEDGIIGIGPAPRRVGDWFKPDTSLVGVTVYGPCHFLVEGMGGELSYVRDGRLEDIRHIFYTTLPEGLALVAAQVGEQQEESFLVPLEGIVSGMLAAGRGGLLAFGAKEEPEGSGASDGVALVRPLDPSSDLQAIDFRSMDVATADYEGEDSSAESRARDKLSRTYDEVIDQIVRFSTVDGAVVATFTGQYIAFGSKLEFPRDKPLTCIDEAGEPVTLGGSRHTSAAKWVGDHKGRVAVVVSQDQRVSVFWQLESGAVVRSRAWRPSLLENPREPS